MVKNSITKELLELPFWTMSGEEVKKELRVPSSGFSEEEVSERIKIFGENVIKGRKRFTKLKIILDQIKSPLIFILILAGLATVVLREWIDAGVILAAILVNTALGYWQENKAENVLELLKSYIHTHARVRRSGGEREIDASMLVPGDLVRITQGDRIPADARLLFTNDLEIDESVLTGESLPVKKNIEPSPVGTVLTNRNSMVFGGTLVVQGFADAVITSTGEYTEFGKIAALVSDGGWEATPLRKAVSAFAKIVGIILSVLVAILFGVGIYVNYGIFDMFIIAVAVAVSAVPEGLPIALTVILAVGVQRLASRKGIVRKLLSAETLGSTSLILTDKTGTLTQAKMELAEIIPFGAYRKEAFDNLLAKSLLNADVVIENPADNYKKWQIFGNPLEMSLVKGAADKGILYPQVFSGLEVVDRIPFNSKQKYSAIVSGVNSKYNATILGAPEIILFFTDLTDKEKEAVLMDVEKRAVKGERVLGVVSKEVARLPEKALREKKFSHFNFLGILSFRDPLRPEVKESIRSIFDAGVKTVIVTGDHKGTAEAVARELGLIDGEGAVLTGEDLRFLKKEELYQRADKISVYARVTPAQKVDIVKMYKEKGESVAVTGDGVNDAPALRVADIGVAVGSGTDVTKNAADLIILDDNFKTIVAAIEEGRKILDNIRKVIVYLLSDVMDELLLIGGSLVFGLALPLNALQILFVNFFSDSFPAIAFAFEEGVDNLGKRPRKLYKNLFDKELRFYILFIGIATSFFLFMLYFALLRMGFPLDMVRTFIFTSFATYTLILAFALRSLRKSILQYNPFSNFYLTGGVLLGIFFVALAVYIPFFQKIFGTVALSPIWLLGVLVVAALNILAVEMGKWVFRRRI